MSDSTPSIEFVNIPDDCWDIQPEPGYRYAEFRSECPSCWKRGLLKDHWWCHDAWGKSIPHWEVLTEPTARYDSAGYYILARRKYEVDSMTPEAVVDDLLNGVREMILEQYPDLLKNILERQYEYDSEIRSYMLEAILAAYLLDQDFIA